MEHGISPSTLDRWVDFMEFLQSCPRAGLSWIENFDEYRRHGRDPEKCIDRTKALRLTQVLIGSAGLDTFKILTSRR